MELKNDKNCYVVYAYSDEDWNFYYIGKGKPKRPYSNIRYVKKPEDSCHIHILCKNLDEDTAYMYEKSLISLFGRKDLFPEWGTLLNSTNGGGGTSGYKWKDEGLLKISGPNHHRSVVKNWCHCQYGFVKNKTSSELIKMFPGDKLNSSALSKLSSGELNTYKGWVFIEENEINFDLSDSELSEIFSSEYAKKRFRENFEYKSSLKRGKNNPSYSPKTWCHSELGLVIDKSCSEIVEMFPETEASPCGLSMLSLGKTNYHKRWVLIREELIDRGLGLDELKRTFSPEYAKNKIDKYKEEQVKNNPSSKRTGELNYMYNKRGHLHPSFGMKRSENTCSKISEKARSRFTGKDWHHPVHGTVRGKLVCELVEMFPEQNLSPGNLSSIACGTRKRHKGWELLDP
jgi:hypothetical protein